MMTTQKEKITITGNHVEVTPALHDLAHKKFDRLLKHFGKFTSAFDIILKVETPKNQIAEVNAHVLHGTILNATATTPDLYKSIDEIAHKMEIQLEKYKGLHFNHHEEVPLKMKE
jgi:putative sigma-54 modulation protein